ncbi:MAG: 16S rRNA (cytosine(1402)-N(4))-methyltransferase RsmH [Firmicutes bacterium]|jgi:16S rRNA (cytosine1402-N4)-methyltransferase|nr:16S rRNA (cytosine(1402)-N(4))-methyltransferase RsmH [Bacillota bacterium]MDH7496408.1 16S rRNA (cytosine(1402)-N(4))-methyltransferase RsmH [Bacillota bacterium]
MNPESLKEADAPRPYHVPVMRDEVLWMLRPRPRGTYVDCTVGGGGHAAAVLEHAGPGAFLVGIDKDPEAIECAGRMLGRFPGAFKLVQGSYADLAVILAGLGITRVDGVLFDLGVASHQFDDARRGFSYMSDGPLDMRMNPGEGLSAYDLVNGLSAEALARILREYGEERWASRIARFIVDRRKRGPITTTAELVDVIKQAIPAGARRSGPHPAKRSFQALRIAVNDELRSLSRGLDQAVDVVGPGGRIVVIAFHSLEDRMVKRKFSESRNCLRTITVRALTPCDEELTANPRSRSARLRAAQRF